MKIKTHLKTFLNVSVFKKVEPYTDGVKLTLVDGLEIVAISKNQIAIKGVVLVKDSDDDPIGSAKKKLAEYNRNNKSLDDYEPMADAGLSK